jgi:hypothetical protein
LGSFGVVAWRSPQRAGKLALPYTAPIQEFRAFLQRTERYPSLVTTTTTTTGAGTTADSDLSGNQAKRLILIEDLPFLGHLPALRTFQVRLPPPPQSTRVSCVCGGACRACRAVLTYSRNFCDWVVQDLLLHHLRTPGPRFPLVLIISDDSLGNSPLFRLLPQEIMSHPAFRQIKYARHSPPLIPRHTHTHTHHRTRTHTTAHAHTPPHTTNDTTRHTTNGAELREWRRRGRPRCWRR